MNENIKKKLNASYGKFMSWLFPKSEQDKKKRKQAKKEVNKQEFSRMRERIDNNQDNEGHEAREKRIKANQDPEKVYIQHEIDALKRNLGFPSSWMVTGNEVHMYNAMRTKPKAINRNSWMILGAMIAGIFVPPIAMGMSLQNIGIGLAIAVMIWFINYFFVKQQYSNYCFKNQLRFNKLLTVLDLSELKRGFSIVALLSATAKRFDDKVLSEAIMTLNSRIQDKPLSPAPYIAFAREFSTTQRARLFMMSVYRMAQGNYDDSEIKSIKHSASEDLSAQSVRLMKKKEGRYNKLMLMQFGGFVIFLIAYVLYFIGINVMQTMKGAL